MFFTKQLSMIDYKWQFTDCYIDFSILLTTRHLKQVIHSVSHIDQNSGNYRLYQNPDAALYTILQNLAYTLTEARGCFAMYHIKFVYSGQ